MTLPCFLLLAAAFAAFALSTDAHHAAYAGARPTPARQLRLKRMGAIALLASTPFAIVAAGWVFGPILWTGLAMLAAGLVFLAVNLPPTRGRRGR